MHARMRGVVATAAVSLSIFAVVGTPASSATRRLAPTSVHNGRVVYSVRSLRHRHIVRAEVRGPGYRHRVPVSVVRRAARKGGSVKVKVPASVLRRAAAKHKAKTKPVSKPVAKPQAAPVVIAPAAPAASPPPVVLVVTVDPVAPPAPDAPAPPAGTTPPASAPVTPTVTGTAPAGAALPDGLKTWRAPGSKPLTDAAAAALVKPSPELRPQNTTANLTAPTADQIAAFHSARYLVGGNTGRLGDQVITTIGGVSGNFVGTTDEIFQWVSYKWGIPLDVVRAAAQQESNWRMSQLGDPTTVADSSLYPAYSRISATRVYQSLGILQVKWRADGSLHVGTNPLRYLSTAFNVDYWAANIRFFYDGDAADWFSSSDGYGSGAEWLSVGAWFNPTPWNNADQQRYMSEVEQKVAAHAWTSPGF